NGAPAISHRGLSGPALTFQGARPIRRMREAGWHKDQPGKTSRGRIYRLVRAAGAFGGAQLATK
ncbi:hypothetical protein J2D73_20545, partial [Acetobacter sacchari]